MNYHGQPSQASHWASYLSRPANFPHRLPSEVVEEASYKVVEMCITVVATILIQTELDTVGRTNQHALDQLALETAEADEARRAAADAAVAAAVAAIVAAHDPAPATGVFHEALIMPQAEVSQALDGLGMTVGEAEARRAAREATIRADQATSDRIREVVGLTHDYEVPPPLATQA